jgi:TRAP-type C4-dicarboxylate transport system permease small subunit
MVFIFFGKTAMSAQASGNLLSRMNKSLVTGMNLIAIWALAAMMFLTFADVLLRYLFNSPIQGAAEIIEFLMVIVIPFSIAFCAQKKAHIAVDFIIEGFSARVRRFVGLLSDFLMLVLFVPISWQSIIYIIDEFESNLTSPVLYIPVYPFVGVLAFAFLVLALILIEQFISSLREFFS